MNKVFLSIFLIFSGFFSSFSQTENKENVYHSTINASSGIFLSDNFSVFNSSISPNLNFVLNPKLNVNVGFYTSVHNINIKSSSNSNYIYYRNYLYSKAEYRINKNIILTGDIIYGTDLFTEKSNNQNNFSFKSYSFGATYNVTNYLQFQVNFRSTQFSSPYILNNNFQFN